MTTLASWSCLVLMMIVVACRLVEGISRGKTILDSTRYPFVVTFVKPDLCGGAIIGLDPPWVLTAAHCVESIATASNESTGTAGAVHYGNAFAPLQKQATIAETVIHPRYQTIKSTDNTSGDLMRYDLGLVRLREPLRASDTVNRVSLWNKTMLIGRTMPWSMVGSGYTDKNAWPATQQQLASHLSDPFVSEPQSSITGKPVLEVTSNSTLCHGDSGNALVARVKDTHYLIGILTFIMGAYDPDPSNPTCPEQEQPNVPMYNIFALIPAHLDWISNVTQIPVSHLTAPTHAFPSFDIRSESTTAHPGFRVLALLVALTTFLNMPWTVIGTQ